MSARRGRPRVLAVIAVAALLAGQAAPFAADLGQPAPAQQEFVPVSELPQAEQLPAAPLLIAAYAFVWVALLAYVWSVRRRLGQVEQELADIARKISTPERRS